MSEGGLELKVYRSDQSQGEPSERRTSLRLQTEEQGREINSCKMETGFLCTIVLVISTIGALLIVILVPLSFSDLEYYEMGFAQRKSTGAVDRSKVYTGGRHFVGVDYKFKIFRADAHFEKFEKISFFNKDRLEVTMTHSLQYFLIPDELRYLHDTYDLEYAPTLRQTVSEAVKNAATQFSVDDYRLNRKNITAHLFKAAKMSLGGICCFKDCVKYECLPGCKRYDTCSVKEKGLFAYVKYFQLQKVDIADDLEKQYLERVLLKEKEETEDYKQKEKIERKKTEKEKIEIQNKALEVSQNATAKAGFIKAQAAANAKAIVEDSRNSGLQIIYSALNVTEGKHKKSLDYIRTLRNHKNAFMYVGFTTLIGREGN